MTDPATTAPELIGFDAGSAPASTPPVIHLPHMPPSAEKKRPKRQRGRMAFIRLDDAELADLEIRARAAGLSLGAYCRKAALGDAGPRAKRALPTAASQQRAQHITAINRVGNLVNQGIHALNEIKRTAPEAVERDRLAYELEAVRKLLEKAIPALNEALSGVLGDDRQG